MRARCCLCLTFVAAVETGWRGGHRPKPGTRQPTSTAGTRTSRVDRGCRLHGGASPQVHGCHGCFVQGEAPGFSVGHDKQLRVLSSRPFVCLCLSLRLPVRPSIYPPPFASLNWTLDSLATVGCCWHRLPRGVRRSARRHCPNLSITSFLSRLDNPSTATEDSVLHHETQRTRASYPPGTQRRRLARCTQLLLLSRTVHLDDPPFNTPINTCYWAISPGCTNGSTCKNHNHHHRHQVHHHTGRIPTHLRSTWYGVHIISRVHQSARECKDRAPRQTLQPRPQNKASLTCHASSSRPPAHLSPVTASSELPDADAEVCRLAKSVS